MSEGRPAEPRVLLALVAIVAVAAALRLGGLSHESLWNDELDRWRQARQPTLAKVIQAPIVYDAHPPEYRILLHLAIRVLGDSEAALRLPSAVSGILATLAIFYLGVWLYSPAEGLIAAAFTAVLWCPVYYSQDAGPYSILLLLSALSTWAWLRWQSALDGGAATTAGWTAAYVALAAASAYLHYFGVLLVFLQGLVAGCLARRRWRRLTFVVGTYLVVVLLFWPWLPTMWRDWSQGPTWIPRPDGILTAFGGYLAFAFNQSWAMLSLVLLITAVALGAELGVVGRPGAVRARGFGFGSADLLLVGWLVAPFVAAYCISLYTPVLVFRNLMISVPAAYLLAARRVTRLPFGSVARVLVGIGLVAVFLAHLLVDMRYYSTPHKEQFREVVRSIVARDAEYPNSRIIGFAWNKDYLDYYFRKQGSRRRVDWPAGEARQIANVAWLLDEEQPPYVWFVRGHRPVDRQFLDFLTSRLALVDHRAFIHTDVWLFRNPLSDTGPPRRTVAARP